jgi:signal transduction histidine kinase
MITSINTLLLQKYRLSQQYRVVQEQYRTNIADISHDLKTPITTMSGYIDLLVLKYQEFGNKSPEVNLTL